MNDYNEGDLSDEDFDQFDCELEQSYLMDDMEIEDQFNQNKAEIGYKTDLQEKALNELYCFSGLYEK